MKNGHGSGVSNPLHFFKFTLLLVAGLTVLSLIVALYLASLISLTQVQERLFDTCSSTWKIGFGAIVALLAGRAIYNAGRSD